jgi:phage-related protein
MYQVFYYTTVTGRIPVKEFIDGLDELTQARFFAYVNLLKESGPNLKRPYADIVQGKIREIRPRQGRVLYFFAIDKKIILVHGFLKKKDQIDQKDIDTAIERMNDWWARKGE